MSYLPKMPNCGSSSKSRGQGTTRFSRNSNAFVASVIHTRASWRLLAGFKMVFQINVKKPPVSAPHVPASTPFLVKLAPYLRTLKIGSPWPGTTLTTLVSPLGVEYCLITKVNFSAATTPRNQQHHIHPSRSLEPLNGRPPDGTSQSNAAYGDPPSVPPPPPPQSAPTPITSRQYRSPPSAGVLSRPEANPTAFPSTPPMSGDSNATTNTTSIGNGTYSPPNRPFAHPRKASLAESFTSVITSGSNVSAASPTTSSTSLQSATHQSSTTTPTLLPGDPSRRSPASRPSIDVKTPTNTSYSPMQYAQSQMLSPDTHTLSRDSRISLPDEARQYIANMADSPISSPRVETFSPKSRLATSVFPPASNGSVSDSGAGSEFLDLDGDDSDEEIDQEGEGDVTANAGDPSMSNFFCSLKRQNRL